MDYFSLTPIKAHLSIESIILSIEPVSGLNIQQIDFPEVSQVTEWIHMGKDSVAR